jgi:hypothetical protein
MLAIGCLSKRRTGNANRHDIKEFSKGSLPFCVGKLSWNGDALKKSSAENGRKPLMEDFNADRQKKLLFPECDGGFISNSFFLCS